MRSSFTATPLQALAKIETKEAVAREQDQKYLQQRSQVKAEAPHRWNQLVEILESEVASFNQTRPNYLSITNVTAEGFIIGKRLTSLPGRTITLKFDREVPRIDYTVEQEEGPSRPATVSVRDFFCFSVQPEGVWLMNNSSGNTYSVPKAAEYLLDRLVE